MVLVFGWVWTRSGGNNPIRRPMMGAHLRVQSNAHYGTSFYLSPLWSPVDFTTSCCRASFRLPLGAVCLTSRDVLSQCSAAALVDPVPVDIGHAARARALSHVSRVRGRAIPTILGLLAAALGPQTCRLEP